MAGPFDFLHLKRRTAGSSNELSFDVLDAARSNLDAKKGRSSRRLTAPKAGQGSFHGVAGTSTLSAVPEVERRKRQRRIRMMSSRMILALILVAGVVAAGFFGYRFYQDKMNFTGQFKTMIEHVSEVDTLLVQVDALMKDPSNTVEAETRASVEARFGQARVNLEDVRQSAYDLVVDASSGADHAALEQMQDAVDARMSMFAAAEDAFALSRRANNQAQAVERAWQTAIEADATARQATELANSATTEEATLQARELTESARTLFVAAQTGIREVEQQAGNVDLTLEKDYLAKRIEALDAALKTADCLLAGDRQGAAEANAAYNAADRQAATLASGLPVSVGDYVKASFDSEFAEPMKAYEEARSHAATVDSSLRSYCETT